jgi:hypothetical protein
LAVKIYRQVRSSKCGPLDAIRSCLTDYQNPVPLETLEFQIRLAAVESSDLEFVRRLSDGPIPRLESGDSHRFAQPSIRDIGLERSLAKEYIDHFDHGVSNPFDIGISMHDESD